MCAGLTPCGCYLTLTGIPYGRAKPRSARFCGSRAVYVPFGGVLPPHTMSRREPRNQLLDRALSYSEPAGYHGMDRSV